MTRSGAMAGATAVMAALLLTACGPKNLAQVDGYTASANDATVVITFHAPSGLDVSATVQEQTTQDVRIEVAATSSTDSHLMDHVCQQVRVRLAGALGTRAVEINGAAASRTLGCPPA